MDIYSRCLVSIYALAFSIWSIVIPNIEMSPAHLLEFSPTEESIRPLDQLDKVFLVSQNNHYYSVGFRADGNNDTVHFFNQSTFQYVFLKNIFATAYILLKAHNINFEFIQLIYPFHYFW